MEYISVATASGKFNISERQIRNLCADGKIPGAKKCGKIWLIPEDYIYTKTDNLTTKFQKKRNVSGLKYNYVIIHSTFGHPGENWFPWIAKKITKLDTSGKNNIEDILIPHFPSSSSADYDSWKSVLMGYIDSGIINKNTIFICHSLGPLFVSRVLIEQKIKVKGMISVEAATNHLMGNPSFDNINKTFFVPSWEYLDMVKKYVDFNYCFYTDNDPHIPFHIVSQYVKHAATKSFFIPGAGHFNTASGYNTFPQLLKLIEEIEDNADIISDEIVSEIENDNYSWNKSLSHKWTNMTWPNRPSNSELSIYSEYVHDHISKTNGNKLLILGSNVEFRDWAYEEFLDTTLMFNNEEYHLATYRELRHKNAKTDIVLRNWKEIDFENRYDFIAGDQLIGNLTIQELDNFMKKVAKSLKQNGYFFSKSYFSRNNIKKSIKDIFSEYYKLDYQTNPIAYLSYDLSLSYLKGYYLDFKTLLKAINQGYEKGYIKLKEYDVFNNVGFDEMTFKFLIPSEKEYLEIAKKYFNLVDIKYTNDIGSQDFPLYILQKK